jgi:hypothetical protein
MPMHGTEVDRGYVYSCFYQPIGLPLSFYRDRRQGLRPLSGSYVAVDPAGGPTDPGRGRAFRGSALRRQEDLLLNYPRIFLSAHSKALSHHNQMFLSSRV